MYGQPACCGGASDETVPWFVHTLYKEHTSTPPRMCIDCRVQTGNYRILPVYILHIERDHTSSGGSNNNNWAGHKNR